MSSRFHVHRHLAAALALTCVASTACSLVSGLEGLTQVECVVDCEGAGDGGVPPGNDARATPDRAAPGEADTRADAPLPDAEADAVADAVLDVKITAADAAPSPAPVLTGVSPASLIYGSGDTTVTLSGAGFVASSAVVSSGRMLASTTKGPGSITAVIPASQLATLGKLSISVTNPSPGGGTSGAQLVSVACSTAGVDYPLAQGTVSVPLAFGSASARNAPRIIRAEEIGADQCPAIPDTRGSPPYLAFVVQNTTAAPLRLGAWTACGANTDAFLTFYAQPTLPTNLSQCTGVVAEGSHGTGGHASPESGSAIFCPGLVGSNTLPLATCARAVVLVQPYVVSPSSTWPSTLKLELD